MRAVSQLLDTTGQITGPRQRRQLFLGFSCASASTHNQAKKSMREIGQLQLRTS